MHLLYQYQSIVVYVTLGQKKTVKKKKNSPVGGAKLFPRERT